MRIGPGIFAIVRWCLGERCNGSYREREVAFLSAEEAAQPSANALERPPKDDEWSGAPSDHDAHPFDLLEVDFFRVLLELATVGGVQTAPRDEDRFVVRMARLRLWRQLKVALI